MQISAVPGFQLGETVKGTATVEAAGELDRRTALIMETI